MLLGFILAFWAVLDMVLCNDAVLTCSVASEAAWQQNNQTCPAPHWSQVVRLWSAGKSRRLVHPPKIEYTPWPSGVDTCANLTTQPRLRKEPQKFQVVEDRPAFVFSAYYERRPTVDGPSIRVIAGGWQKQFNDIGDFYCQMWFKDKITPMVVPAKYEVIYNSIRHADMWVAHFILCPLKSLEKHGITGLPYAVSVTPIPCTKPKNSLMVINKAKPKPKRTFALCISAIYGKYRDWLGIAEMFEMWTLLGANEIVIYNYSLSEDTNVAMQWYRDHNSEANITVVQWPLPKRMHLTATSFQRGVFNDCLYRQAHKHMFVAMQDLDEVIVPRNADNYQQIMEQMYAPNRAIYMFQHNYFRRNVTTESPYSITQSSFWTTTTVFPAGKIRCKSMYNPMLTKSVDVHYHYFLAPGQQEYMVPPDVARLHHYRIAPMETFRKDKTIEFIEDRHLEKYKPALMANLRHAVNEINAKIRS